VEFILHQREVRADVVTLGFEIVEAEVNFKDKRLEISGTIDGKIEVRDPDGGRPRRIPVEIKSTAGAAPANEAAWRDSETPLLRRYYAQLQTYLYLTNEPEGLGIFKDKITGLWSVVPVALDFAYVEKLLQRAERIAAAVAAWEADQSDNNLPSRLADRSECNGCPFKDTVCLPSDAPVDPLLLAVDDRLLAQLEEREACDPAATRFDKIDKLVKERFKLTAGTRFVVGGPRGFIVTKKVYATQTRITIERMQ
jgi:hypothetical protein